MAKRVRRYPVEDDFEFMSKCEVKGLKSNSRIFCPQLNCSECICLVCYNCELGFNGVCEKFNDKVEANPMIIKELYRPVPELFKEDLPSTLVGCGGNIITIGTKRDKRKKLQLLKAKFKLRIRFIPKYETVELPYSNEIFFKEGETETFAHAEIVHRCKSDDIIYSVNLNEADIEAIKLMEKLNVRNV
jgi:hypothetical protein